MGVMHCDRYKCKEILCRRLVLDGQFYVCEGCWDELLRLKSTWEPGLTKGEMRQHIEDFLETAPGASSLLDTREALDEAFEELTRGPILEEDDV